MKIISSILNAYRLADKECGGRYALTGCRIQRGGHNNDRCRITATDGKATILSEWTDSKDRGHVDVIVDRKMCRYAARHHNDSTLTVSNEKVTLHNSTRTITGRHLEGRFPDVPKVFSPADNAAVVVVDACLLKRMLTAIIESQGRDPEGRVPVAIAINRDASLAAGNTGRDLDVTLTAHNDVCNTIAVVMGVEVDPSRREGFLWRPDTDKAEGGA